MIRIYYDRFVFWDEASVSWQLSFLLVFLQTRCLPQFLRRDTNVVRELFSKSTKQNDHLGIYVVENARRKLQRCPDHLPFRVVLSLSKKSYRFSPKSELAHITMKISCCVIHDVWLNSYPFLHVKSWMSRDIYNVKVSTISRIISIFFFQRDQRATFIS